jgi:hypothetical protein
MGILLAVLALTGSLLAAAGTWLSAGWLILAGGMTLLISLLAVPSTRSPSSPAIRPAPRSLSHDLLRNPGGNRDAIPGPHLFRRAIRGGGHRRIADGQTDRGSHS